MWRRFRRTRPRSHSEAASHLRHLGRRLSPSPLRWRLVLGLASLFIAYAAYSAGTFMASSASGKIVGAQTGVSEALGYDSCSPPTAAQVNEQWSTTSFAYLGVYLGGITATKDAGCEIQNRAFFVEAHLEHEHREAGIDFLPIWDGRQDPCSGLPYTFSENPSEGYAEVKKQAAAEVEAAVGAAETRSFITEPGSILYYDLEGFGGVNTTEHPHCVQAAKEFINVWVKRLHEKFQASAGVYGSTSASNLKEYYTSVNIPNDVWFAESGSGIGNEKSVYAVNESYLPMEDSPSRRFHQYTAEEVIYAGGNETVIDRDCGYGLVAGFGGSKAEPACHAK